MRFYLQEAFPPQTIWNCPRLSFFEALGGYEAKDQKSDVNMRWAHKHGYGLEVRSEHVGSRWRPAQRSEHHLSISLAVLISHLTLLVAGTLHPFIMLSLIIIIIMQARPGMRADNWLMCNVSEGQIWSWNKSERHPAHHRMILRALLTCRHWQQTTGIRHFRHNPEVSSSFWFVKCLLHCFFIFLIMINLVSWSIFYYIYLSSPYFRCKSRFPTSYIDAGL